MTKKAAVRDKSGIPEAPAASVRAARKAVAKPLGSAGAKVSADGAAAGRPSAEANAGVDDVNADPHGRHKVKLVRDSFTIPKDEYAVLEALKARAIALARPAKKSELLRAGIAALQAMSDRRLLQALDAVPSLKTGRPKRVDPPGADEV